MSLGFPELARLGDIVDRFRMFVEQLEEGVRLLETGRAAGQRMALVAFDMLAEGLLFHHLDIVFLVSDEPYRGRHRRFTASERRQARESFNKRVALAVENLGPEGPGPFRYPPPILDAVDAAIFRVGHHYRNPVYHRDRHNPALIEPVGRLYAQAVGRVFVRSQRDGYGISCPRHQLEEIERLGWRGEDDFYFRPREAAEAVVARLCGELEVDVSALRSQLADDLGYRCDVIDEDLAGLRDDGLTEDRLAAFLADVQDWAASRGDEVALRLEAEHQALEDEVRAKGGSETAQQAMREIERQQWDHVFGRGRERTARVDMQARHRIRRAGERLRGWPGSAGPLLEQYQRLDSELEVLEGASVFMLMQWDRRVQADLDAARGK